MKSYFITGTDTNCGKTYVTCQLLAYFQSQQQKAFALKPVVTGCMQNDTAFFNEDLQALTAHNFLSVQTSTPSPTGPWFFTPPIAPHLAAQAHNQRLSAAGIHQYCQQEQHRVPDSEYFLIEGAGGVMVPLNEQETWLDFLKLSNIPVILVVAMRLGCLNHAILTMTILQNAAIPVIGWVANCMDKGMLHLADNIMTLQSFLAPPLLTTIHWDGKILHLSGQSL